MDKLRWQDIAHLWLFPFGVRGTATRSERRYAGSTALLLRYNRLVVNDDLRAIYVLWDPDYPGRAYDRRIDRSTTHWTLRTVDEYGI